MLQENVQVLWNKQVGPSFFKLGLSCNPGYADAVPGQFITLRMPDQTDPLLRRPFSIHQLIKEGDRLKGIEILYKVIGKNTQKYSELKKNDYIDLLGPSGNGFSFPKNSHHIYIVGGGIGIAPLVFLTQFLKNNSPDLSGCSIFLGGRSKQEVLCKDDFSNLGINNVLITTDDGSEGEKGLVTNLLEKEIKKQLPDIIYACGPHAMLKSVAKISESYKVPCQVSVETIMACGMGACLGCAVEKKSDSDRYSHVCIDGPVFDTKSIAL